MYLKTQSFNIVQSLKLYNSLLYVHICRILILHFLKNLACHQFLLRYLQRSPIHCLFAAAINLTIPSGKFLTSPLNHFSKTSMVSHKTIIQCSPQISYKPLSLTNLSLLIIICLIRGLIFFQGQSKLGSSLIKCEFEQQVSKNAISSAF